MVTNSTNDWNDSFENYFIMTINDFNLSKPHPISEFRLLTYDIQLMNNNTSKDGTGDGQKNVLMKSTTSSMSENGVCKA